MKLAKLLEVENSSSEDEDSSDVDSTFTPKLMLKFPTKPLPLPPHEQKRTPRIPKPVENRFSLPMNVFANYNFGLSPVDTLPRCNSGDLFLKRVRHKGRNTLVKDFQEQQPESDEEKDVFVDEKIKKLIQEQERNALTILHRSDLLVLKIVRNRYEKKSKVNFLYYECYKAQNFDKIAKGICLVIHGLHEHCQRYKHVCELLAKHGYAVFALDLHGHGRSSGLSGYVRKFEVWIEQCNEFIQTCIFQQKYRQRPSNIDDLQCAASTASQIGIGALKNKDIQHVIFESLRQWRQKKFFILGQGIGATISFVLAQRYQCPCILSAPLFLLPQERHSILQKVAGGLATFAPKAEIIDINLEKRCHSEFEIIAFKNDPYCRNAKLRVRVGYELIRICKVMTNRLENAPFSMLILHGAQDFSCDVRGSIMLHEVASSKDKTLKVYDSLWHDLLHEDKQDVILQEIVNWMNDRAHVLKESHFNGGDQEFFTYSMENDDE